MSKSFAIGASLPFTAVPRNGDNLGHRQLQAYRELMLRDPLDRATGHAAAQFGYNKRLKKYQGVPATVFASQR